jgi:hypothetical protein
MITIRKANELIEWTDEQIEEAGIDRNRLVKIIQLLRSASDLMTGTGLHVYGESGSGNIVHSSRPTHSGRKGSVGDVADYGSVIADVGLGFDGGGW